MTAQVQVLRFLLGFALVSLVGLGLIWLLKTVNPNECTGRTLGFLVVPLILGPLSIGLGTNKRLMETGWGPFSVGMIAASVYPVLWTAVQGIASLNQLCGKGNMS